MDWLFKAGELFVAFVSSKFFAGAVLVAGVTVAITSIKTARDLARKKQSADLMFNTRGDQTLQEGIRCIEKHHFANNSNIRAFAEPGAQPSEELAHIKYVLNHFEAISIGVQAGIYDEQMLKMSWYGIVTTTFEQSLPLIKAIRERDKKDTVLQEFEWLAKRWLAAPLAVKRS
jgi:hypothetical protein